MNFENVFPNNDQITNDSSSSTNTNQQIKNLKTKLDHLDNGNNQLIYIFDSSNVYITFKFF